MKHLKVFRLIHLLRKSERGAAAAEYALILAIIGSVIAIAALGLGTAIGGAMDDAVKCVGDPTANNC
ncbi:MAG: Flp family type IVb pilin [Alphaproteobacteria bacterium]|nr:MAG: Flp family type IVb pilin [Alphaproteobacteria bacterium]